jgi:hypothetical protein
VINPEPPSVGAPDRRPRHDKRYHEAGSHAAPARDCMTACQPSATEAPAERSSRKRRYASTIEGHTSQPPGGFVAKESRYEAVRRFMEDDCDDYRDHQVEAASSVMSHLPPRTAECLDLHSGAHPSVSIDGHAIP